MDSIEREEFWKALCKIQDDLPEHIHELVATIKHPQYLCRFRSVNESSLQQLQENKLFFSSADYYDDPFDTFIHVDFARIKALYKITRDILKTNNPDGDVLFKNVAQIVGISAEQFVNNLKNDEFDLSSFVYNINHIRTTIQKLLFSICFCEDELNETLWIKYANNYKGFSLVYDVRDEKTFLCGIEDRCKDCKLMSERPYIYPVYYSAVPYDATQYALACLLTGKSLPSQFGKVLRDASIWQAERISLIKKKCHEYDQEWRMIRPEMMSKRTYIKMKPHKIILGLKMPDYERMLVISAARLAGISTIEELYINDLDQLASRVLVQA
ncbi:hypothetical protein [Anaerovibrio sp.]|uniref:hypothetical protein n=1 Tax=Anaerovibrio sp. TaxID=1872532 RepID=UPI00388DCB1B